MQVPVKSLLSPSNSQIISSFKKVDFVTRIAHSGRTSVSLQITSDSWKISTSHRWESSSRVTLLHETFDFGISTLSGRVNFEHLPRALAASPVNSGVEHVEISSSPQSKGSESTSGAGELKMRIHVSGDKTQTSYDYVFSRLVDAAQPIPGFRRVKGGKTPDVPKEVLLHILGQSKVNKEVIKKIINTSVAECVANEKLEVTKDLKIEETYEELEATFQPGQEFSFNAIVQLRKTNSKKH